MSVQLAGLMIWGTSAPPLPRRLGVSPETSLELGYTAVVTVPGQPTTVNVQDVTLPSVLSPSSSSSSWEEAGEKGFRSGLWSVETLSGFNFKDPNL